MFTATAIPQRKSAVKAKRNHSNDSDCSNFLFKILFSAATELTRRGGGESNDNPKKQRVAGEPSTIQLQQLIIYTTKRIPLTQ